MNTTLPNFAGAPTAFPSGHPTLHVRSNSLPAREKLHTLVKGLRAMDITPADYQNRPTQVVVRGCPEHSQDSTHLAKGYVYGLLAPDGRLQYIGSTRRSLKARMACWRSAYHHQHTTSPLLRFAAGTSGLDSWTIVALKQVHFCPVHSRDALSHEEASSIDYWRSRGCELLNTNRPIDANPHTRTYQRMWREQHGQGQTDENGRSLSNSAIYCREWRRRRREARQQAAAADQTAGLAA